MKKTINLLAAAATAGAALAATPGAAQVNGIATSSPEAVIVRSAARQAGYQQISQTYASQLQQVSQLRQQNQQAQQSLDTNSDGQLTEAEVSANPTVVQQIQQREQQIAQVGQPIALAQAYVIQQLVDDYQNVQTQVVQNKNIQLMLSPDAIQYAPEGVNVTDDLVAALDARLPTVQTTPPAGWQPRQQTVQLQQTVQQILIAAAQQQAAQQQQQQAQPSGR
ncbi:OmpH family outer membrane protein [Qipengyuania sp. MTN3-11]|uniref:OmpH family outer membrane protein n=1 Tax=Qipengyuania sp. MTN3-11 TaxID=3056557 RepID=UPI0036F23E19